METEIKETPKAPSLQERLKALTEKKEPPKASEATQKPSYANEENFAAPAKEDLKKTPDKPTEEEKPSPKATQKMKEASANSIIGLVDITNRIFIPVHHRKFRRKFTEEEQRRLNKLGDMEKEDITEASDRALVTKCEKLLKKLDKKIADIPLKEEEKTDLRTQLMAYMDYKEKVLPPEIGLIFTAINILGGRIIDVVTD